VTSLDSEFVPLRGSLRLSVRVPVAEIVCVVISVFELLGDALSRLVRESDTVTELLLERELVTVRL